MSVTFVPFGSALIFAATVVSVARAASVMMALSVWNCTLNVPPLPADVVVVAFVEDVARAVVVGLATAVVVGFDVVAATVVELADADEAVDVVGAAVVDVVVAIAVVVVLGVDVDDDEVGADVTIVATVVDAARPVEMVASDRSSTVLSTLKVTRIGRAATAKYAHRPYSFGSDASPSLTVHTLRGVIGKDGDRGQPPGDSSRRFAGA
jgi:hypothetical protein